MEKVITKYCPTHGTMSGAEVNEKIFCGECGTMMIPLPECKCGNQIYPIDKFCTKCGAKRPDNQERGK